MAGRKPESFTEKENEALRAAFQRLVKEQGWSQAEAGRQLGIGQQAAGTILSRGGGFSRPTAVKLAARLGHESPDALLRELGAVANPMTVTPGWAMRDLAVMVARKLGYDEEVIRRVVVKYQENQYFNRPARWWNERIVAEALEHQAVREMPSPEVQAPSEVPRKPTPSDVPKERHRRRAG